MQGFRVESKLAVYSMVYESPMSKRPQGDLYSEAEAQRRFLDALKAGLTTPPKPLKDKPKL